MESSSILDWLGLFGVVLLVLANSFFVAAEFSLVSVRRTRIAEMVAHGQAGAEEVEKAIQNPDRVIAATQLGITLASLALGWIGEPALSHLLQPLVSLFPIFVQSGISHSLSAGLSFVVITCLHVVVGELAPKSIALQYPEQTSVFVAGPTLWTERIFKPAILVLNGTGNALLRLLGVKPASGHELVHSVEELRMLVTASTEGGAVEVDESEMLHAVFDFRDLVVRQVMVPRTEIIAVPADATMPEIISLATQSSFTKFPVYEEGLDQILGIVHIKDLLTELHESGLIQSLDCPPENAAPITQNCMRRTARQFMREPIFVPETIPVSALLHQFRDNRQHIAIVMDEFGGTAGLVTLEDLLEEIVGEVSDPFDMTLPEFQPQPDGSVIIDGMTLMEVVNSQLDLELHDPDYDTLAGYMLGKLGRIPHVQDVIESDGVRLRVEEMDGLRISRISLSRLPAAPQAPSA